MQALSIDIETRSTADLTKTGVYRYAEDESFDLLLFGYSLDHKPVKVIDIANGEQLPDRILESLVDPMVTKWAFNASFERVCLSSWLHRHHSDLLAGGRFLDPAQWRCTMIWSAYLGLPMSLEAVSTVLDLDIQKNPLGKRLIKTFCTPDRAGRIMYPEENPIEWAQFKTYNACDVEVEQAIQAKLTKFPVPDSEWDNYVLDQHINDNGIQLDERLVDMAVACDTQHRAKTLARAKVLTGLENPNSPLQLKEWLNRHGCPVESLTKTEVSKALNTATGAVREVLELRSELAKSSVKKYQAMQTVAGADGRARGLVQFYGAGRTGRFAGRLVQVQNLPRNYLPDLDQARNLIRDSKFDALEMLYPSVPDTLSQLIRTAFIPSPGHRFIVADFAAIEARVIAWLAGEQWRLDLFNAGGDIYCQSASQMFGVPVIKNGANSDLRQKGKIAELACGYNGSVGALKAMGALTMGLVEHELQPLVDAWRDANPNIVGLWADVDEAAKLAITTSTKIRLRNLVFSAESGMLFITLPSSRRLAYVKPGLGENRFGATSITYEGLSTGRRWSRLETYGGKLVENITQAVARDLLTHSMSTIAAAGHQIVMHVHDEIIIDTPNNADITVKEICELMTRPPAWATGLPLDADGYECVYYMKN